MSYRTYAKPYADGWFTEDWRAWIDQQKAYYPVNRGQQHVCEVCWGPVGRRNIDNDRWWRCSQCKKQSHVQAVVPISYSWRDGLESIIYRAKDDRWSSPWLNNALTSLLHGFLENHLDCIESYLGQIDVITVIPSNPATRNGWDHMKDIVSRLDGWPKQGAWDVDLLTKTTTASARQDGRRVTPDAYALRPGAQIQGRRVLLIDDLWTSGSTFNSAALTIGAAGGQTVALPIGRQFTPWQFGDEDTEFQDSIMLGDCQTIPTCAVHQ